MILILFVLVLIFGIICLFLGYTQYSFPMAYLGMFVFLVLGLMLFQEGLAIPTGTAEVPMGSHQFVDIYTTYTTVDNTIISLLANSFFFIPLAGVMLSTLFALRR